MTLEKLNLVDVFEKLSSSDCDALLFVLKRYGPSRLNVHRGLLPFVSRYTAVVCIERYLHEYQRSARFETADDDEGEYRFNNTVKKYNNILIKLGYSQGKAGTVTFMMWLNDNKIQRMLRGRNGTIEIPSMVTMNAGIQWQEFGKKFIKPEVIRRRMAHLKFVAPNFWEVTVDGDALEIAKGYLFDRAGSAKFR